jgi:hypothetical protein
VALPAATADKSARTARRWIGLRFSLRTLLVAITFVCVGSGLVLSRAVHQRAAVRRFLELGAQRSPLQGESLPTMLYAHNEQVHSRPILPEWQRPLVRLLGEEAFGTPIGVQILDTPATDDDLRLLADLPAVRDVWLSRTKVTDQGLAHLKQACPQLTFLTLDETAVTDAGLARLSELTALESLSLSGTRVTDAGLVHLARLKNLKHLWLRSTPITGAGYRQLQAALPTCEIQADVPAAQQRHQRQFWGGYPSL